MSGNFQIELRVIKHEVHELVHIFKHIRKYYGTVGSKLNTLKLNTHKVDGLCIEGHCCVVLQIEYLFNAEKVFSLDDEQVFVVINKVKCKGAVLVDIFWRNFNSIFQVDNGNHSFKGL